jgi:hypothetical protein
VQDLVTYSAAATVVALLRDMPKTMTMANLGEALLDSGSAEQVWDEHVGQPASPARPRTRTPGCRPPSPNGA